MLWSRITRNRFLPQKIRDCVPGPIPNGDAARCDASLRLMPSIEIVFETQVLNAAAMAPHQLQGLYPDFDMPFDIVRGHRLIRRFSLHTLRNHWLIGQKKHRASRNMVGKSRSKDCWSLHVDRHTSSTTQHIPKSIIVFQKMASRRVPDT